MELKRAYATFEVKAAEGPDGKRKFIGVASTPSVDRMGDVIEPEGMEISIPTPLLWQHDSSQPIGWVRSAKVTKKGVEVECEVAAISEDGPLKARLDECWQMLKTGLVRGLSVGFNVLESSRIEGTYGYRFIKTQLLELSTVTIPANQDCGLTSIKSADQAARRSQLGHTGARPVVRSAGKAGRPPEPSGNKHPATAGFFLPE